MSSADEPWYLFQPHAARQVERIRATATRFVHYTSADAGFAILRSGRMLLRNSVMMNDFSEVQHGANCLFHAYASEAGKRLKLVMEAVRPGLEKELSLQFDQLFGHYKQETYLLSISEHSGQIEDDEDRYGRLSMWRAYAGRNGIAFVFNNTPFVTESDALNAYTSPVVYADADSYLPYFREVVDNLEANIDFLKEYGGDALRDALLHTFRFAIQSTKHPSFREEREWRVIYSPTLLELNDQITPQQMERVPTDLMVLNGIPQRVYALPFQNHEEDGFVGATIPELIDRILIGPSADADVIAQAFVSELGRLQVDDAASKVIKTNVPLRV